MENVSKVEDFEKQAHPKLAKEDVGLAYVIETY